MIRILRYGQEPDEQIFARAVTGTSVADTVSQIIETVKTQGDAALLDYTARFDGASLKELEVTPAEKEAALRAIDPEFLQVLQRAAENIRAYHSRQVRTGFEMQQENGIVLGQRVIPLDSVGVYVPGGKAAYPSTVLMDTIPAKLAGVGTLVMVTPPGKDGAIAPAILAAAQVAGVDRIFKVGGAQAVAALAYGTETIPRVDKIVGPGNAFVAEAKKQVFGQVAIDMIAGPSEILVVADSASNAEYVAADLLSQAEHDPLASAVLITDSMALAREVQAQIEAQLTSLEREQIARASIENNGKIIVTDDLTDAIRIANAIAPEHLELCVEEPFRYLDAVRHAGSVFLGRSCPEALGDYYAGPNHTLPTSGTARFSSPLSVDEFIKTSQYIYYTPEALQQAAPDVAYFAGQEGLTGHARSVLVRTEGET